MSLRDLGIERASAPLPQRETGEEKQVAPIQRLRPMPILAGESDTQLA